MQVAAAAICWGCWSLFLRPAGLSAWVSAPLVLLVVGVATWPLVRFERSAPLWDRTSLWLLAAYALLDCVNVGAFFGAMEQTTLAIAVLTHYATPLLVALAAPYVDGERVPGAWLAALLGTLGLALVLAPWAEPPGVDRGQPLLGGFLGLISAFAYAANVFVCRRMAIRIGPARAMSYHALAAFVLLAPVLAFVPLAAPARSYGLVLTGGVLLGALPGILYLRGIRTTGATRAAILTFIEPTVAVGVGWLVFGERLGWTALLGAALVLGSGLWVSRPPPKRS